MKKWSARWTQFMQLRKEAWKKKFRTSTGFEPVTSRLPVRCFTNWAMKPLTLGAGQLWVQIFPWKKWVLMINDANLMETIKLSLNCFTILTDDFFIVQLVIYALEFWLMNFALHCPKITPGTQGQQGQKWYRSKTLKTIPYRAADTVKFRK